MASSDFKYADHGAYHWSFTYNNQLRRYDPRNHARYDVPLSLLRKAGFLDGKQRGLEIGCGDGVMLYKTMLHGGHIVGLDLSLPGLRLARKEIGNRLGAKPELLHGSCYELPVADGAMDFIVSLEVIEHLPDVDRFLKEIRRVLRPGGYFVLTTPHCLPSRVPQDPYHIREYDPHELATCLQEHFSSVTVLGMYPALLDRLYFKAIDVKLVDQLVRAAFKLTAKWIVNPYSQVLTSQPNFGWANLAASCRR